MAPLMVQEEGSCDSPQSVLHRSEIQAEVFLLRVQTPEFGGTAQLRLMESWRWNWDLSSWMVSVAAAGSHGEKNHPTETWTCKEAFYTGLWFSRVCVCVNQITPQRIDGFSPILV